MIVRSAHIPTPVTGRCVLVEVRPDGSRVPAVKGAFGEDDLQASTFRDVDSAASFAVDVLRRSGCASVLDIQPAGQR